MNVEEFKKRFILGNVEPELFFVPQDTSLIETEGPFNYITFETDVTKSLEYWADLNNVGNSFQDSIRLFYFLSYWHNNNVASTNRHVLKYRKIINKNTKKPLEEKYYNNLDYNEFEYIGSRECFKTYSKKLKQKDNLNCHIKIIDNNNDNLNENIIFDAIIHTKLYQTTVRSIDEEEYILYYYDLDYDNIEYIKQNDQVILDNTTFLINFELICKINNKQKNIINPSNLTIKNNKVNCTIFISQIYHFGINELEGSSNPKILELNTLYINYFSLFLFLMQTFSSNKDFCDFSLVQNEFYNIIEKTIDFWIRYPWVIKYNNKFHGNSLLNFIIPQNIKFNKLLRRLVFNCPFITVTEQEGSEIITTFLTPDSIQPLKEGVYFDLTNMPCLQEVEYQIENISSNGFPFPTQVIISDNLFNIIPKPTFDFTGSFKYGGVINLNDSGYELPFFDNPIILDSDVINKDNVLIIK